MHTSFYIFLILPVTNNISQTDLNICYITIFKSIDSEKGNPIWQKYIYISMKNLSSHYKLNNILS